MNKFNIGDKVISKGYPYLDEEVGVIVGIDPKAKVSGKYLVKFDSIKGLEYELFCNNLNFIIEPYEGYAEWVDEDDLEKVENESEEVCMSKFNIGDKVVAKDYPRIVKEVGVIVGIDPREDVPGKYLVKFDSLDGYNGWAYGVFINNPYYNIDPYEGRAIWLDDLEKVEDECEEEVMNEFNIGDKVFSNDGRYYGKDVGVIVGINPEGKYGKYLVKFDSLDMYEGWSYGYSFFVNNPELVIEPYEGRAIWLDDLIKIVKVEDEYEKGECEEDKHEEDIKMEFDKIREQKKEVIKSISEKVLEMTLEIKEMEHEIEKIKKEWHLD